MPQWFYFKTGLKYGKILAFYKHTFHVYKQNENKSKKQKKQQPIARNINELTKGYKRIYLSRFKKYIFEYKRKIQITT